MSTQSNDSLLALIQQLGIKLGNQFIGSNGLPTGAGNPLSLDVNNALQAIGLMPITQTTITEGVLSITGTGAQDIMTQTLVGGADATTFTKSGFIRVKITDAGGRVVNGYHYIQVGTLT